MEQAIQAHYRFKLNQHYLVDKNKIVIIDEFTGRRMPDRHWRDGLHQAVEAKEKYQSLTVMNTLHKSPFKVISGFTKSLAG